jgi:hypothetical protein
MMRDRFFRLRRKIIIGKLVVGVGLVIAHYLPPEHAVAVSIVTNLAWLFLF